MPHSEDEHEVVKRNGSLAIDKKRKKIKRVTLTFSH